jgi:CrcB protein
VFGAVEMMKDPLSLLIAVCYLVISLAVGFIAVELGIGLGAKIKPGAPMTP